MLTLLNYNKLFTTSSKTEWCDSCQTLLLLGAKFFFTKIADSRHISTRSEIGKYIYTIAKHEIYDVSTY